MTSLIERIESANKSETLQHISDVSPQAEIQRLRGLFAALAADPDACAVARDYARVALAADAPVADRLLATKSVDDRQTAFTSDKGEPA